MTIICKTCSKRFKTKLCLVKRGRKYCSRACTNIGQRKGKFVECHTCGKSIWRTSSNRRRSVTKTFFCDMACRDKWSDKNMPRGEDAPRWNGGYSSYRKRALRHYGQRCSMPDCDITKAGIHIPVEMLDVDHIDNDRDNNDIQNLQVLCVWCHAKKTREVKAIVLALVA